MILNNRSLGKLSSIVTGIAVFAFAISLICGVFTDALFAACFSSIFIALGFLPFMISLYTFNQKESTKACGLTGICFAVTYITIIFIVYFAQCTTMHLHTDFSQETRSVIDFGYTGSLFFNYDLFGYACMALSTFFTGMIVNATDRETKVLKALLLIHGIFFFSCFIMPMFPIFTPSSSDSVGSLILVVWCIYFLPISILGYRYFTKQSR